MQLNNFPLHAWHAKLLQSCLTLCDPVDCSPESSSVQEFSRQEYWNGLPCPPPGDRPHPGLDCVSGISCIADRFFTSEPPGKPQFSPKEL